MTVTGLQVPPNSEIQRVQEYKDEEQVVALRCGEDGIEVGPGDVTWATVTWRLIWAGGFASKLAHCPGFVGRPQYLTSWASLQIT